MRGNSRRGYRLHIALAVFLGLVAALGIDVKLAHSQTNEAEALTTQFTKLYQQGRLLRSDTIGATRTCHP